MNDEQIDAILELVEKSPRGYFNRISNSMPELKAEICAATSFLEETAPMSERVWYAVHKLNSRISCAECGKEIRPAFKARDVLSRRVDFKCRECSAKSSETLAKIKATKSARYGSPSYNNRAKAAATCIEKYGVPNAANRPEAVAARKIRNESEHGDPNWNNSEKTKATVRAKASADPDYWENITAKRAETIRNSGMPKNWNNAEKASRTCMEHNGVAYGCLTRKAVENRKKTFLEKYGNENFYKTEFFKTRIAPAARRHVREQFYRTRLASGKVVPKFSESEYAESRPFDEFEWKCLECGTEFKSHVDFNAKARFDEYARCPNCHPQTAGQSEMETELFEFAKSALPDLERGRRDVIGPFELDMYSESAKLAIEFDGLYQHGSAAGKDKTYHLRKTEECEKNGITLIHVFEDEWLESRNIVESKIKNMAGMYDKTIYARKCDIRKPGSKELSAFLEKSHLQGGCRCSAAFGLYFENELVSVMTFGKCRFSKKYEWEMLRFCVKPGYHVPGGAGRLLKHFEREYDPKSLVSYADRRWSRGKLYRALGFELDHTSPPAYWYIKNQQRFSRMMFQKKRLSRLLEKFDERKTELENMSDNGYSVIYDCGNYVFLKKYDKTA